MCDRDLGPTLGPLVDARIQGAVAEFQKRLRTVRSPADVDFAVRTALMSAYICGLDDAVRHYGGTTMWDDLPLAESIVKET